MRSSPQRDAAIVAVILAAISFALYRSVGAAIFTGLFAVLLYFALVGVQRLARRRGHRR